MEYASECIPDLQSNCNSEGRWHYNPFIMSYMKIVLEQLGNNFHLESSNSFGRISNKELSVAI